MVSDEKLARTGIDAVALKPTECDVARGVDLPVDTVAVDWEGREHLPSAGTLERLAETAEVRLTAPVRADGFDPLGDDALYEWVPEPVDLVLVAGHPAFLSETERERPVAPRLGAARERAPDAWVGTEGMERMAMAAGGPQYELLSRATDREVRTLRAAGFAGDVVVYAPTVLTDDADDVLDAVGGYVARRRPVADALPEGASTDAAAAGRAREVLLAASRDYALVGTVEEVADRVGELRDCGVDRIVGYPARGIDEFLPRREPPVASDD